MTPRPVPTRLAGYSPAPVIETGRVPPAKPQAPTDSPRAYPPTQPVPSLPPIFGPPPIHVPPVVPPTMPPPEPPTEPPIDVPEPGILIILLTGVIVYWRFVRPARR